ncbi:MAG: hypothetical protein EOP01_05890 [Propionibacteriaceae bacterium]|nr:MAG: hypothetical protein EOP01_05890 [Propionibacteriaceae bacterium]
MAWTKTAVLRGRLQIRGLWQPTTQYLVGDVVALDNSLYQAKVDFTSGSVFAAANWNALTMFSGRVVDVVAIDSAGHLLITYSDGTTDDVGQVVNTTPGGSGTSNLTYDDVINASFFMMGV